MRTYRSSLILGALLACSAPFASPLAAQTAAADAETLGERIVDFCLGYVQVQAVHLEIIKLEAHDDCEVGYETRRRR